MLRVRDLRALSTFPIEALMREVGPFVLIQTPPNAVMQNVAMNLRGARTIAMSTKDRLVDQAVKATLAFDTMVVHSPVAKPDQPEFLFGRAPTCDFVVNDPSVSGKHAKLKRVSGTNLCTLTDLGSTNGTFVNARQTTPHTDVKLNDGDSVMLGDATFVYVTVESLHAALKARL